MNKKNIYLKCGQLGQKQPCLIEYIDPLYGAAELWITSIKDRAGHVIYYDVIGDHLDEVEDHIHHIDSRMNSDYIVYYIATFAGHLFLYICMFLLLAF